MKLILTLIGLIIVIALLSQETDFWSGLPFRGAVYQEPSLLERQNR